MELNRALRITNDLGLHARSAAKIVELAGKFDASLYLSKDGYEVEGASILSILTLACPKGSEINVRIVGKEGALLMEKISELFESKFGET